MHRAVASHLSCIGPQPLRLSNRLAGLVQAPLLSRLGAPEAARLPRLQLCPDFEGDRTELEGDQTELEGDQTELEGDRDELDGDWGELDGDWGELECLLAAAQLARRGRQHGSQHGCVLIEDFVEDSVEDDDVPDAPRRHRRRLLGQGWNHAYIGRDRGQRTSRHVHAEAHAVADAIRRRVEPLTSAHGLGPSLMPQTRHVTPVHADTMTFALVCILGCLA